ncbi:hypothetical protein [Hahella ganghwensis]|uniref:hypothetical protein n=1 Tax=Hahella ganghwensis TaxID=286420 RepID=UPI0003695A0F|nr:hypothetical protein [Hahella ganghwensis]
MRDKIRETLNSLDSASEQLIAGINRKLDSVSKHINGLQLFASLEKTDSYEKQYDEMHYFVVPYKLSAAGFSLHTTRCLPTDALEVNDLPKRRVFHLPNEHYETALKSYLIETARELSETQTADTPHSLEELADSIDNLDRKLTYGMLLVGGLTALVNPLAGAGIAAKAMLPGIGPTIGKYGLRTLGSKLSQQQKKKALIEAEKHVLKQFTSADTIKVINPILQELELALRTTEQEHDPLTDFNLATGSLPELDGDRWKSLTEKAVQHTYQELLQHPDLHTKACLGPEDIRWLKTMFKEQ